MRPEMYRLTYQREGVLWWYLGMDRLTDLLLRADGAASGLEILDAGCGTGGTTRRLERYGRVTGIDLSDVGLGYARSRGLHRLVRGSTAELPFREGVFDLVTSFDVMTMLPRDRHGPTFAELRRVLRPGGRLFLRVGAYNWLRGEHDHAGGVVFRYRRRTLAGALRRAGFAVRRLTYANALLMPAALLKRLVQARDGHDPSGEVRTDFWLPPRPLNAAMAGVLHLENALIRRGVDLPAGLSIVALAERSDG